MPHSTLSAAARAATTPAAPANPAPTSPVTAPRADGSRALAPRVADARTSTAVHTAPRADGSRALAPRVADARTATAVRTAVRAAIVATSTAAAALVATLPAAAPAPVAALPTVYAAAPATTPSTAMVTFDRPATPAHTATLPTVTASVAAVAVRAPLAASRRGAMQNALGKLGARYRWGAAGPSAFDCSGLVYWSYRQSGIALPRTSRAMSGVGTPVAKGDLQPGDLVFFYRPVSHVAIYIGNGQVVHASTAGSPVKISSLSTMPFTTARRI